MYTTSSELGTSTVPAFLSKLWTLVEDPDTNELICWDVSGKSFHVFDQTRFAKEILPLYFKHNNIASFIRQLNMYGFRKVITVEAANIKMEKDDVEFAHPYFIQGQESLLEFIKRKAPNPKAVETGGGGGGGGGQTTEDLSRVYADVAAIKGRQDSMTSKLEHLKIENEVLWKELVSLRQRHIKQEQIVNKLIQFLVTLVGDRTLGGMKRKLPLMLQDGSAAGESLPPAAKIPRSGSATECALPDVSTETKKKKQKTVADNLEPLAILKDGEMHSLELTDLLDDVDNPTVPMSDLFPSTSEALTNADGANVVVSADDLILARGLSLDGGDQLANVEPAGIDLSSLVTCPATASEPTTTIARADTSHCGIGDFDKDEMSTQLDNLQSELDHVRDVFTTNGTYNFDPNTLFELPPYTDLSFPSFPLNMLFNSDSGLLSSPKMLFSPDVVYLSTPNLLFGDDEDNELAALEKSKPKNDSSGTVVGNELIQYNPPEDYSSLFEQFATGASSFGDPMGLTGQDDLDELFETNKILHSSEFDHQ